MKFLASRLTFSLTEAGRGLLEPRRWWAGEAVDFEVEACDDAIVPLFSWAWSTGGGTGSFGVNNCSSGQQEADLPARANEFVRQSESVNEGVRSDKASKARVLLGVYGKLQMRSLFCPQGGSKESGVDIQRLRRALDFSQDELGARA